MTKTSSYDNYCPDCDVFQDAIEATLDCLEDHMNDLDYDRKQIEEVKEKFQERLTCFLQEFLDDLPDRRPSEDMEEDVDA
jgi:hypothetical protein